VDELGDLAREQLLRVTRAPLSSVLLHDRLDLDRRHERQQREVLCDVGVGCADEELLVS